MHVEKRGKRDTLLPTPYQVGVLAAVVALALYGSVATSFDIHGTMRVQIAYALLPLSVLLSLGLSMFAGSSWAVRWIKNHMPKLDTPLWRMAVEAAAGLAMAALISLAWEILANHWSYTPLYDVLSTNVDVARIFGIILFEVSLATICASLTLTLLRPAEKLPTRP